jgi:pyruvate,water dikinase
MEFGALFRHWSLRLLAPDRILQQTYEAFKILLAFDGRSHELMAEFEALYHEGRREDLARTRIRSRQLIAAVEGMATALARMHPGQAGVLRAYLNKYGFYIRLLLEPPERFLIPPFVVGHDDPIDAAMVGSKSHRLHQLKHAAKASVPDGFTITAAAFDLLVAHNQLRPAMDLLLAGIDPASADGVDAASQALMTLVRNMEFPDPVRLAVLLEYDRLAVRNPDGEPWVAVRSSALHEDGDHSFAGQYHSVLGVNREGLLAAYLEVLASKYTPQALLYRIHAGLGDEEAAMAALVLVMVDAAASGVMYTRDPAADGEGALLVHAVRGLGLPLVGGEVVPDVVEFAPESAVPTRAAAGSQQRLLALRQGRLCDEPVARDEQQLAIAPDQAERLVATGRELEAFFQSPQDIEWAIDRAGRLFVLQSRPLRLDRPRQEESPQPALVDDNDTTPLLAGARTASGGIAHGLVCDPDHLARPDRSGGAILVTRHIPPSLVRHIDQLAAVICEQGSVTGHFATVCREFGVVLLVEAAHACSLLAAGMEVTVDGYAGKVYPGVAPRLRAGDRQRQDRKDSAHGRRLRALLDHITPLRLLDPTGADFRPQSCRSLHDIIRYAHEKAVQTMFGLGDIAGSASSRCRKLATDLPLDIYLLDVGGAFADDAAAEVAPETLRSAPFFALWQGLSDPRIDWQSHLHFDWQGFGDMALSGGIASGGSRDFASYAVISPDYLNLNMRFGFHFTLLDCLAGLESRANYCQLRFAGGGGDYRGRSARIVLLSRILVRLGFEASVRGDLLDARLIGCPAAELQRLLVEIGRLLGMTKLQDMVLREEDIDLRVQQFFQGADWQNAPATSASS